MHPSQQLLPKFITSQTPSAPHSLKCLPIVQLAPLLHDLLKMLSSRRAVFRNTAFSQEPVTPQPAWSLARCTKVVDVAAPGKSPERLLWPEQLGPNRV